MHYSLFIGPISNNSEATLKLTFGNNVSATRVLDYAQYTTNEKEKCGLISNQEAVEMIRETAEKLKSINLG